MDNFYLSFFELCEERNVKMSIEFNPHKNNGETLEEWLINEYDIPDPDNAEEVKTAKEMIEKDSICLLTLYNKFDKKIYESIQGSVGNCIITALENLDEWDF